MQFQKTFRNGSKYSVEFEPYYFEANRVSIPMYELKFEQIEGKNGKTLELLNFLANNVIEFVHKNKCLLLLYHTKKPIKISDKHKVASHAQYRSLLFNRLFERSRQQNNLAKTKFNLIIENLKIPDDHLGDHYLSYICNKEDKAEIELHTKVFNEDG
jgi:hypothetical protein